MMIYRPKIINIRNMLMILVKIIAIVYRADP